MTKTSTETKEVTWGERDRFVGARDQRDVIEQRIDVLRDTFKRELDRGAAQLREVASRLDDQLAHASDALSKAHDDLSQTFQDLLSQSSQDAQSLRRTASKLEARVARLYPQVRLAPGRNLDRVSPRGVITGLMEGMRSAYADAVAEFPKSAIFVKARRQAEPVRPGERICDVQREAVARAGRASRVPFARRARCVTTKWRLWMRYELIDVPARDVARSIVLGRSELRANELIEEYAAIHSRTNEGVEEAWRIVRSNFGVAIDELVREPEAAPDEDVPDPKERVREIGEIVAGSLARARERITGMVEPYNAVLDSIVERVEQNQNNMIEQLASDMAETAELSTRLRWAWRRAAGAGWSGLDKATMRMRRIKRRAERIARRAYFRAEDTVLRVGRAVGVRVRSQETLLAFADMPNARDIKERTERLPPICRRLFAPAPLQTAELLVGRDLTMAALADILDRWRKGRPSSVAVVGPEGSGKTSLLNCFEHELGDSPRIWTEINERVRSTEELISMVSGWFGLETVAETIEELANQILELPRQVAVVEGGHYTMLRAVDRKRIAEAFMFLVLTTRARVFWVITFRKYPWQRMDELFKIGQYFTHVVETPFHSIDELCEAILLRQRISGLQVRFSEEGVTDRKIRKLLLSHAPGSEIVQNELSNKYFTTLFAVSGGNMDSALFYWSGSLSIDSDGETIVVSELERPDVAFITKFERLYLFTLAEILNNGTLSIVEHAEIFRTSELRSQTVMNYLIQIQLIKIVGPDGGEADSKEQQYGLNPVFWHILSSSLEASGVLY